MNIVALTDIHGRLSFSEAGISIHTTLKEIGKISGSRNQNRFDCLYRTYLKILPL